MIRGKKIFLSKALSMSGLSSISAKMGERKLIVFNYHRIRPFPKRPGNNADAEPFDSGVFGPDAEQFRAQVKWLRDHATILTEDELIDVIQARRKLPRSSVMISFDDGYRDNFELALPILKEFRVPAIFFIPTATIDELKLGWWDEIAYLIKKTKLSRIAFQKESFTINDEREQLIQTLHKRMKDTDAKETENLVRDLSMACQVQLPSKLACGRQLMTWEQIRAITRSGCSIGSHTHTHRVLATMDLETQRIELENSKRILEEKIGLPIRSLAYPVGGYEHFHLETMAIARECGYSIAFSFRTGINRVDGLNPYDIRRVSAPDDADVLSGMLSFPGIFSRRRCELAMPATIHP